MRDMDGDFEEISGDPYGVLKLLDNRLGKDGNVLDVKDVVCILELMEEAKMLVDRCMFVNILRATRNRVILLKFMEEGGWDTLYKWLQEARLEVNKPLIIELLKLYKHLPITVTLLKQNNCAKDIRQLSKSDDNKIEELAKEIIGQWMLVVKENSSEVVRQSDKQKSNGSGGSNSSSTGKSSSSHAKSLSSGVSKGSSGSSSSHSSTSSTISRNSSTSAPDRLQSSAGALTSSNKSSSGSSPGSKDKQQHRPKTVKTPSSTMRSTGNDEHWSVACVVAGAA